MTLLILLSALHTGCPAGERPKADQASPDAANSASAPTKAALHPRECAAKGHAREAELAFLPSDTGVYCIDGHTDPRSYGADGGAPLVSACELLSGGCELYQSHGLARVTTAEYVAADGSRALVLVARFGSPEGAFGAFTARVGPRTIDTNEPFEPLRAGSAAALGTTTAIVHRAERVVELRYSNDAKAPSERAAAARVQLPALAAALGKVLPGKPELPIAARLLPAVGQRPLGTYYAYEDLLAIPGLGRGAVAEYRDTRGEFFIAITVALDDDAAKDVLKTLRRHPSAKKLKFAPYEATRITHREGDAERIGWVFGRKGLVIAGVGRPSPPRVRGVATEREREKDEGPVESEKLMRLKELLHEIALD